MKSFLIIFVIFFCLLGRSESKSGYSYLLIKRVGVERPPAHLIIMTYIENMSIENLTHEHNGIIYTEEWKSVFDSKYHISSFGRLKTFINNPNGRILSGEKRYGYIGFRYYTCDGAKKRKWFFLHRLVANAFIRKGKDNEEINHRDCIKNNNFFLNLEWCTHKENIAHSWLMGKQVPKRGLERKNVVPVKRKNTTQV